MTHCHNGNDEDFNTHISKGYQVQKSFPSTCQSVKLKLRVI